MSLKLYKLSRNRSIDKLLNIIFIFDNKEKILIIKILVFFY
jgi:hypothetical protein